MSAPIADSVRTEFIIQRSRSRNDPKCVLNSRDRDAVGRHSTPSATRFWGGLFRRVKCFRTRWRHFVRHHVLCGCPAMHSELTNPKTSATQRILLPGLDGTARLFDRFIQAAPNDARPIPIALPAEPLTYTELVDTISAVLPNGRLASLLSLTLVLAIAIAARRAIDWIDPLQ
jgi:hypothetical protein